MKQVNLRRCFEDILHGGETPAEAGEKVKNGGAGWLVFSCNTEPVPSRFIRPRFLKF